MMNKKTIFANENESDEMTMLYYKLGNAYFGVTQGKAEAQKDVDECISKLKDIIRAEEDKELEKEGLKRCPECGEKVTLISRFCNLCGYKFEIKSEEEKKEEEQPAAEAQEPPKPMVCPFCKTVTEPDAVFCPECGKKIVP